MRPPGRCSSRASKSRPTPTPASARALYWPACVDVHAHSGDTARAHGGARELPRPPAAQPRGRPGQGRALLAVALAKLRRGRRPRPRRRGARRRAAPRRCPASTCPAAPRPRLRLARVPRRQRPHRPGHPLTPTARSRCTTWRTTTEALRESHLVYAQALLDHRRHHRRRGSPGGRPRVARGRAGGLGARAPSRSRRPACAAVRRHRRRLPPRRSTPSRCSQVAPPTRADRRCLPGAGPGAGRARRDRARRALRTRAPSRSSRRQATSASWRKAYRWFGKFLKRLGRAEAALEAFELAADLTPSTLDSLAPRARRPTSGCPPTSAGSARQADIVAHRRPRRSSRLAGGRELLIALERYDEAEELLRRQLRSAQALDDRDAGQRRARGAWARSPSPRARVEHAARSAARVTRARRPIPSRPNARVSTSSSPGCSRGHGDADAAVDLLAPLLERLRATTPTTRPRSPATRST